MVWKVKVIWKSTKREKLNSKREGKGSVNGRLRRRRVSKFVIRSGFLKRKRQALPPSILQLWFIYISSFIANGERKRSPGTPNILGGNDEPFSKYYKIPLVFYGIFILIILILACYCVAIVEN